MRDVCVRSVWRVDVGAGSHQQVDREWVLGVWRSSWGLALLDVPQKDLGNLFAYMMITQIFLYVVMTYWRLSRTWWRSNSFMLCKPHCDSLRICLDVVIKTLTQQEKCRLKDIAQMCRRQYLRSFLLTHVCESDFPTTLVEFFSRYPGLRRFIGTHIVLFSTAVDDADLQRALSPAQTIIQNFGTTCDP